MAIDIAFCIAIGAGLLYALGGVIAALFSRRRATRILRPRRWPGVSIFKPLKGVDDQLEENLHSFFQLDYPHFQLVFGLADRHDPAVALVRRLQKAYPGVESTLVVSSKTIGRNPKINNLNNMLPRAHHPLLVINDSNIRVEPHYLRQLVPCVLQQGTGLVCSTIRGMGARRIGSILEILHLNGFVAGSIFLSQELVGITIPMGKSMIMRRSTLDAIGGFAAFKDYLAEDYLIGEAIQGLSLKTDVTAHTVDNINQNWSLVNFLRRQARWTRIRWHMRKGVYFSELLSNPVPLALIYGLLRWQQGGWIVLLASWCIRLLCDGLMCRILKSDTRWYHCLLAPFKDLLIFILWFVPFFSRRVSWRGNRFRIGRRTRLLPLEQRRHSD